MPQTRPFVIALEEHFADPGADHLDALQVARAHAESLGQVQRTVAAFEGRRALHRHRVVQRGDACRILRAVSLGHRVGGRIRA